MTTTPIDPKTIATILNRADLYKLPSNGLQILCHLASNSDSLPMGKVARFLEVSTAAVTGTADVLEKLGMVTRQHSRADRRMIRLQLADKGHLALLDILNA